MKPRSPFLSSQLLTLACALLTLSLLHAQGLYAQSKYTEEAFIKAFPKPSEELIEAANKLYQARCAHCHGRLADGTGALRQTMRPRPRNLRVRGWFERVEYAERTERLKQVIVGGGPALGLSPLMPPNPDLEGRPELLYALIYHLAAYHKPPAQPSTQKKEPSQEGEPSAQEEGKAQQEKEREARQERRERRGRRGRRGRRRRAPLGPPSSL